VVRTKPDLVYAIGPGAALFKGTTIPVVALTGNPLGQGIAQTLAHPGGNITGVSVDAGPSIQEKRIELLREMVPAITILGVIVLRTQWEAGAEETMRAGCDANGIRCAPALLDLPTDESAYRQAVDAAQRGGAEALMIADNPDAFLYHRAIIDAASAARLPSMYFLREFVEAGGLMAYSFDLVELNEQAARGHRCGFARRAARRHPVLPEHQVQPLHQSDDRKGARPHCAAVAACACRPHVVFCLAPAHDDAGSDAEARSLYPHPVLGSGRVCVTGHRAADRSGSGTS
jgi:ABC transporter substrate binding protein